MNDFILNFDSIHELFCFFENQKKKYELNFNTLLVQSKK